MIELSEYQQSALGRATLGDQLRRHAQHRGDSNAVTAYGPEGEEYRISYFELNNRVDRIANYLIASGVGRGDRVAVLGRNSVDWMAVWYAALKIGAPLTGVNPNLKPEEISYQLAHAAPSVLFVDEAYMGLVEAVAEEVASIDLKITLRPPISSTDLPGGTSDRRWVSLSEVIANGAPGSPECDVNELDIAMIVYTSGTEARSKGVMIPHRNYLIGTTPGWVLDIGISADDRWLFVMPFFTMAGIGSMTNLTQVGASLVIPWTIDAGLAIRLISSNGVTTMAQTPTFYLGMARHPDFQVSDLSSLRRCITYGGLVPKSMLDAWSVAKPSLLWGTFWSQSELSQLGTSGWFTSLEDIPQGDPAWIGRAMPGLEFRVVDAEGADSDIGEMICRSPAVMRGYFNDPERTEAALSSSWLHTGDVMRVDGDGNLFFVDRLKDVIKTGGMNVSSVEVERILMQHPVVERAAVVGMPDPYWSEAVTAFVVVAPGETVAPELLIEFVKDRLASFKAPKAVYVVDALPTDSQGKVLKRTLRQVAKESQND